MSNNSKTYKQSPRVTFVVVQDKSTDNWRQAAASRARPLTHTCLRCQYSKTLSLLGGIVLRSRADYCYGQSCTVYRGAGLKTPLFSIGWGIVTSSDLFPHAKGLFSVK